MVGAAGFEPTTPCTPCELECFQVSDILLLHNFVSQIVPSSIITKRQNPSQL
jgi:hypothetical protein